jgi:hypothetical protein
MIPVDVEEWLTDLEVKECLLLAFKELSNRLSSSRLFELNPSAISTRLLLLQE